MRNFRKWEVWENAKKFVKDIYEITAVFPDTEKFGLTNQIRRAAVSIPANIAEGAGRRTEKDFRYFLYIALGSAFELETLLDLSHDLDFIKADEFAKLHDQINHIQRQLNAFIQKL